MAELQLRCTSTDPTQRPSAAEVVAALRRCQKSPSPGAGASCSRAAQQQQQHQQGGGGNRSGLVVACAASAPPEAPAQQRRAVDVAGTGSVLQSPLAMQSPLLAMTRAATGPAGTTPAQHLGPAQGALSPCSQPGSPMPLKAASLTQVAMPAQLATVLPAGGQPQSGADPNSTVDTQLDSSATTQSQKSLDAPPLLGGSHAPCFFFLVHLPMAIAMQQQHVQQLKRAFYSKPQLERWIALFAYFPQP